MNREDVKRGTWFGKPLDELTRDELFDVIGYLSDTLKGHTSPSALRAHSLGRVEMLKRGIKYG
jgi:hypothetical protein